MYHILSFSLSTTTVIMRSFVANIWRLIIAALPTSQTQGISTALLDRFARMASIYMATYAGNLCISPEGLKKVAGITNDETYVHGWILRDDNAREIITVFRDTESIQNY